MKLIILFFASCLSLSFSYAQPNNQIDNGQRLAKKVAQKIKDSLNLTGQQMNQLADINLNVHNQKKQVMSSGWSRDSIGRQLQRIENTRDSLYKQVIPAEKFEAYRKKKRNLVNNN
jgi:hypothetical protein